MQQALVAPLVLIFKALVFMQKLNQTIAKQNGAVLILMAFIIGLGVLAYLLHAFDPERMRLEQDKQTMQMLNKAKETLIAWSVSHPDHPGQMPFPDRNLDGNYDGYSDCNSPVSTFDYKFLLGQLPVMGQTNPCINPQDGLAEDFRDADGNRLWYAVSRNLTHIYENNPVTLLHNPVINPDIVLYPQNNPDSNNYPAIQSEVRSYPWLKVLDGNGLLVSDRVAAVIIAPGGVLGVQNRSVAAPSASQYLDSFIAGSTPYSNSNYLIPNQAFVISEDSHHIAFSDTRFVKPYNFNDKLVFITIDELMTALNNRAASEASLLLNQYKSKTGQFPFAAPLDARLDNHVSSGLSQKGLLPIDATDVCSCESQLKCTCSFNPITKVTFTRSSGTWAARSGACTRYSANCSCNGLGSCTNGSEYFTCNAAGTCDHNITGSNSFIYTVPKYADIKVTSGGCYISGKQAICNDTSNLQIGLDVPAWFKNNLWSDFLYYEWSDTSSLKIGSRNGLTASLIATGSSITNELGHVQTRPSTFTIDYLDSLENTNNDQQFESFTKQKTSNYNDQTFVVAP